LGAAFVTRILAEDAVEVATGARPKISGLPFRRQTQGNHRAGSHLPVIAWRDSVWRQRDRIGLKNRLAKKDREFRLVYECHISACAGATVACLLYVGLVQRTGPGGSHVDSAFNDRQRQEHECRESPDGKLSIEKH
jgi:hypothetical protein